MVLDFLGWDEQNEAAFAPGVRIVLVSAEFSKELTTAVLWLNESGLDIRCVRMKPYSLDGRVLLDVQQVIPLPEAGSTRFVLLERTSSRRPLAKPSATTHST